jgi:prenyltransferase beta subunit
VKCMNFDGGFGCVPGAESHAGQVSTRLKYINIIPTQSKTIRKVLFNIFFP